MNKGKTTEEQKPKKYELTDKIKRERVFGDSIHCRLLTNERGTYIDLRKFFRDKPTKRGIRFRLNDYKSMNEFMTECIQELQNQ